MVRIDPQPSDEVLAILYQTDYFEAWGEQTDLAQALELKKVTFRKHVLRTVNLKKGCRVLDCGAAFGTLMSVCAERGLEPYGIEVATEAAAAIGRRFGPGRVFCGPFDQASFENLGDGAFDAVFMCDFIEHVRQPLAALKKAARLLRPEGSLVITTPDTGSLSCRLMGAGWPHYNIEHLYYFNRQGMSMLLNRAGFTVTESRHATKVVNIEYIWHQLNAKPRVLVTPVFNLLVHCATKRMRHWPLSLSLGQMLIVGKKY